MSTHPTTKLKKIRLDQLLVEQGLAPTRTKAQSMILAGLVSIDGQIVSKAGAQVDPLTIVHLKEQLRYVSRGGLKLEGALKDSGMDVTGLEVLDIGASTGGFTDCLLKHGASHVFAIDVGKGQLDDSLRKNHKVTHKESFHVKDLSPDTFGKKFKLIVIDVSFISLKKVLPYLLPCLDEDGHILALIKPQFETQAKHLDKGVLKDEKIRLQIIDEICQFILELGLQKPRTFDSVLKGPKGNQETFVLTYC